MIGFIVPYTFTQLGTTGNTAPWLIYTLYNSPSPSSLVVSWQRIYNSLLVISNHRVFLSQSNSFLAIIRQMPIPKTRLNSIPGMLASRNSTLHSILLCAAEHFFISTIHGLHGKHRLLLLRIVLEMFTAPLHSNGRGADHIENSLSIVDACLPRARLPSRCLAMGIHVTIFNTASQTVILSTDWLTYSQINRFSDYSGWVISVTVVVVLAWVLPTTNPIWISKV
jgi:hypothetical protein